MPIVFVCTFLYCFSIILLIIKLLKGTPLLVPYSLPLVRNRGGGEGWACLIMRHVSDAGGGVFVESCNVMYDMEEFRIVD